MSHCIASTGFLWPYSDWGGCVSLTSLVLLSVSSSDSSREAPSMCSWRRPDRLEEKLIGPPRLARIGSRHMGKHVKNTWQLNCPITWWLQTSTLSSGHTTWGCEWHDQDRLWAFHLSCHHVWLPCSPAHTVHWAGDPQCPWSSMAVCASSSRAIDGLRQSSAC